MRSEYLNAYVMPELVHILITRDMAEVISKTCWKHEVDCYEELHGEGTVQVTTDPLSIGIMIDEPEALAKRTQEELASLDSTDPIPMLQKFPKHPARPVRVGEELDRLRTVFGKHEDRDDFIANIVYPDPRLLVMECGGPWQDKAKAAKRSAA